MIKTLSFLPSLILVPYFGFSMSLGVLVILNSLAVGIIFINKKIINWIIILKKLEQ